MIRRAEIEYAVYERAAMRLLFALVVAAHLSPMRAGENLAVPNGLAQLIDLRFLLDARVFATAQYLLWIALAFYVLRIGWSLVLPYMALISVAAGSLQNSQGAIGHHLQIVSLVLLAQTAAHFFGRYFAGQKTKENENRVIDWSLQAIAATYFVSALTKLIHTGGAWFWQSPLIAVQMIKTTDQDYYDLLDRDHLRTGTALAEWMVEHPLLVALILGSGMLLELTSPLILLGRGWAAGYGLALLLFHQAVGGLMKLGFPYNEYLLWIYLINVPFWIMTGMRWLRRRYR